MRTRVTTPCVTPRTISCCRLRYRPAAPTPMKAAAEKIGCSRLIVVFHWLSAPNRTAMKSSGPAFGSMNTFGRKLTFGDTLRV